MTADFALSFWVVPLVVFTGSSVIERLSKGGFYFVNGALCEMAGITISSEMVISSLLLQVQEDGLDECRFGHVGAVIRQRGDGGGDLLRRCRQPKRSEGGD